MIVGVPRETYPGEKRVALVPEHIAPLVSKLKLEVWIEKGAGQAAGYPDAKFEAAGARISADRRELFQKADIILQVRTYGANLEKGKTDLDLMHHSGTGQEGRDFLRAGADPTHLPRPSDGRAFLDGHSGRL
jgi:NAD(P) transhydrogenase subunit alpha